MGDVAFTPSGAVIGPTSEGWSRRRKALTLVGFAILGWLVLFSPYLIAKGF